MALIRPSRSELTPAPAVRTTRHADWPRAAAVAFVRGRNLGQRSDDVDRSVREDRSNLLKEKNCQTSCYNSCHRDPVPVAAARQQESTLKFTGK